MAGPGLAGDFRAVPHLFWAEDWWLGFADEEVADFGILSSLQFTFRNGRILYISTTHLSPAALEQTMMLSTQGEAWLNTVLGLPTTPRSLNFVKDNFIITVTGDLAGEDLLSIADQLVFE